MSENIEDAPIINNFADDMYCWILDPNSSPQTNRFLLSNFIQEQRITYAVNVGSADAIEIVLKSPLTSYVAGQAFYFKTPSANTGPVTLKVDSLSVKTVLNRSGTALKPGDIPDGSLSLVQYDGTNFQLLADLSGIVTPLPTTLADSAAVAFNMNKKFFDYKRLDTVESAITLTLSNVIEGANQMISVKKNIAGDVTITLTGGGLTFYGYNDVDLNSTPEVVLSGASGDVFDISFLARTSTEIGVALGKKGN